ncbi:MAG: DUF4038 domain-containing protein [Bryobacterales bacterium]|nr:DUF4038 domain-containing protein [Bryobacterales bacterium]
MVKAISIAACLIASAAGAVAQSIRFEAPAQTAQYEAAEFVLRLDTPSFANPFLVTAPFAEIALPEGGKHIVTGFCDSEDGGIFRLRYAPSQTGRHQFIVTMGSFRHKGEFTVTAAAGDGPVQVDPQHPRHFRYASGKPFFHLGYTAYHLLDPSKTEAEIDAVVDYCRRHGFNKIRFLLTGYPRDSAGRTGNDNEHGVKDPKRAPNYGARSGRVNPLPAWEGKPHAYDFTRFHLPHWRRAERAIAAMRNHGIEATAIVTIEKQNLPGEYGRLSDAELRLYRYALARLGAFRNVWWDLGNEHNEFRDKEWGDAMGTILRALDPHRRLASAHAYADFWYAASPWASYIVTQHYGDERTVYDWARKFEGARKPYVNEEYGYEGPASEPGHLQNADITRRTHWAIAMAGGYATYGDWSDGVAWFYSGDPGPGVAATQLHHLRAFFEALPFARMMPCSEQAPAAFCLQTPDGRRVYYLPRGGSLSLPFKNTRRFDPRTGQWSDATLIAAPDRQDWAFLVEP